MKGADGFNGAPTPDSLDRQSYGVLVEPDCARCGEPPENHPRKTFDACAQYHVPDDCELCGGGPW